MGRAAISFAIFNNENSRFLRPNGASLFRIRKPAYSLIVSSLSNQLSMCDECKAKQTVCKHSQTCPHILNTAKPGFAVVMTTQTRGLSHSSPEGMPYFMIVRGFPKITLFLSVVMASLLQPHFQLQTCSSDTWSYCHFWQLVPTNRKYLALGECQLRTAKWFET